MENELGCPYCGQIIPNIEYEVCIRCHSKIYPYWYEYRKGCGYKKISAFAKTAEEVITIKADFMNKYMYLFTPEFIASQDAICAEEKRQESLRLLKEKSKGSIWRDLYISLLILLVIVFGIFLFIHQFT
jgi:hypothetical protein